MSSTWSSGIGKFPKKDPNQGKWGKKIKHWFCKVGLCNLSSCNCDCHCKKEKCCKQFDNCGVVYNDAEGPTSSEIVDLRNATDLEIAYGNIKAGEEYISTTGIKKVKS